MDPSETTDTEGQSSLSGLWQLIKDEISGFEKIFTKKDQQKPYQHKDGKLKSSDLPSSFQVEIDNYWEFLQALPWKEPWMIGLMLFHLFCFVFIILTRKCHNIQYIFFFLLLVTVYCSESINELAANHHKEFSNENYFDSQGLFLSTVFSGPVLLNCLVLILMWLTATAGQLIAVKKHQIARATKRSEKSKVEKNEKEAKKDR